MQLLKSQLQKNIAKLFTATFISQGISVLSSLLLAYFFIPDEIGVFSAVIAFSAIFSIIFSLRSEYPIVLSTGKENNYISYSLSISIISFLVIFFISFFLISSFSEFENLIGLSKSLFLLSLFIALKLTVVKIFQSSVISKSRFDILSLSKVINVSAIILFQLLFFFIEIDNSLVLGFSCGVLINLAYLTSYSIKEIRLSLNIGFFKKIKEYIKTYRKIFSFGTTADFFNSASSNIIPILLLSTFGKEIAGFYFFANRVLSVPLQLISSSTSTVFFQKGSELVENKKFSNLKKLTLKFQFWNGLVMFIILIFVILFLDDLLNFFFDEKWNKSLTFIYILIPFFFVRSLFSPISNLMEILNKNDYGLILNISILLMNLIAINVGFFYEDILISIYIISISGLIGYLIINVSFMKLIYNKAK